MHYQYDLTDDDEPDTLDVFDLAADDAFLDPASPEYGAAIDRLLDARGIDAIQLVHAVQRRGYSVGARHDDGIDGPAVRRDDRAVGSDSFGGSTDGLRALRDILKRTWLRDDELNAFSPVTFGHLLDALRAASDGA